MPKGVPVAGFRRVRRKLGRPKWYPKNGIEPSLAEISSLRKKGYTWEEIADRVRGFPNRNRVTVWLGEMFDEWVKRLNAASPGYGDELLLDIYWPKHQRTRTGKRPKKVIDTWIRVYGPESDGGEWTYRWLEQKLQEAKSGTDTNTEARA